MTEWFADLKETLAEQTTLQRVGMVAGELLALVVIAATFTLGTAFGLSMVALHLVLVPIFATGLIDRHFARRAAETHDKESS